MITLSLEGVSDAIETVKEIIIPWRRKNGERKAKLENATRQAEIQRLNGEALLTRAKAEREKAATKLDASQVELIVSRVKKLEAEAQLVLAQAEKMHVDAEKERADMRRSQIELAMAIVDKYVTNTNEINKIDYVMRLLPILDALISTELKLEE